jgi:hypothetical protein
VGNAGARTPGNLRRSSIRGPSTGSAASQAARPPRTVALAAELVPQIGSGDGHDDFWSIP